MDNDLLVLSFYIAAMVNLSLVVYGWRYRHTQGAAAFCLAMLMFAVLPITQLINLATSDLSTKIIALKIRGDIAGIGATAWLVMVMLFTGHASLVNRRTLIALSIVPFLISILNWIESPLFRSSYSIEISGLSTHLRWTNGPLFWFGLVYLYATLLTPLYLLWRSFGRISPLSLRQTLALSVSTLLPLLVNALSQFGFQPLQAINFPFAAGPFMGLIVAWAIFQHQIFDVVPIARGLLIENMNDGVLVIDSLNRIVDINPAMQRMIGQDAGMILGKNSDTFFAAWPEVLARFRDVTKAETMLVMNETPPQYLDLRISPLMERGGKLVGRLVVVRDISIHKQTEAALRTSEDNFRRMIESAPDAMIIVDRSGKITLTNQRCETMFGYSQAELQGQSVDILLPEHLRAIHKDHRANYFRDPKARPMRTTSKWDLLATRKDGVSFPVEISLSPLESESGILTMAAVHDMTERQQIEAQVRLQSAALQAAANAIVISDRNDIIQWVNPAFTRLTGYTEAESIGQTMQLIRSYRHKKDVYTSIHETIHAGLVWEGEIINRRKDGYEYVEEQTITPVHDQSNEISHFIAIKQDITARRQSETTLRRQNSYLAALHDVTLGLINHREPNSVLEAILTHIAALMKTDHAFIDLVDTEEDMLIQKVALGKYVPQLGFRTHRGEGLTGRVWATGETIIIPDYSVWTGSLSEFRWIKTVAGFPLKVEGGVIGVIGVSFNESDRTFTTEEIDLMNRFANLTAVALDNAQLHADAQYEIEERKRAEKILLRQNNYHAALHKITFDLLNRQSISDLLQYIVDQASELIDAPFCELMLEEDNQLVVQALTRNQPFLAGDRIGRGDAHLSWQAFDTARPVAVDDYSHWSKRRSLFNGLELSAVVALPILVNGKCVGVLDISRSERNRAFDESEIQAAGMFAQLAALALDNAQLREALRQESIHDPLTGLFNRRFMQESLAKELERANRNSMPLAVVMIDLDHLKELNDMFGHHVGDETLQFLSKLMKIRIRASDVACRYGGDEFTLILPDASLENARLRMEEIREDVNQFEIPHPGKAQIHITISAGIAVFPEHGITTEKLLKTADEALYKAKQAGRNKVMTA